MTPSKLEQHYIKIVDISGKKRESSKVTTLSLSTPDFPFIHPGQFLMVWVPGKEEVPMAISDQGHNEILISVENAGETTKILSALNIGDKIGLRGPYGNWFDLETGNNYLLVGSGCGASPLYFAAKRLQTMGKKFGLVIDARVENELCFIDNLMDLGVYPHISTHDASVGYGGYGSSFAESLLSQNNYDYLLTCGPEKMMKYLLEICLNYNIQFQASLERYMKCGFGICGSCVLDPLGLLVCKDGPVFNGKTLEQVADFGTRKREPNGRIKNI